MKQTNFEHSFKEIKQKATPKFQFFEIRKEKKIPKKQKIYLPSKPTTLRPQKLPPSKTSKNKRKLRSLKRLKIWTFNIEGLLKPGRLCDLTAWMDRRNIGISFSQEAYVKQCRIFDSRNYRICTSGHAKQDKKSGVAIVVSHKLL